MDFNKSELQTLLLDSAERFLAGHYSIERLRELRQTPNGIDEHSWTQFAEMGWLGIIIDESLGGFGGSMTDAALLAAAMGAHCVTEPFTSSAILAATILAGAAKPSNSLIERLIAGSARFAFAYDEPGDRFTYDSKRSTTITKDGATWVLSGRKVLAYDAPGATHLIIGAQGPRGFSLVLAELGVTEIKRTDYALYDGSRASDLAFDAVRLGDEAVVAQGDEAMSLLALALDRTRVIQAARALGSMEATLDICAAYLRERQQFGQPIGKFQSLQHIMADMFVAAHQARSMLYFALSALDELARERARSVALARLHIGEAAQLVSRQAIQLHGGYGITDEYAVSHHYRHQLVLEKQYGDIAYSLALAGQLAP